ncbi:hypothetical protein [Variovorax sp. E3]|uniref:hypothetical protein n=1 Tax=Variovorax sp. E3 TaxID=1914993 RepID=UPI0018DBF28C|nr:hypothetical protein [Variovorax sp. E3]
MNAVNRLPTQSGSSIDELLPHHAFLLFEAHAARALRSIRFSAAAARAPSPLGPISPR